MPHRLETIEYSTSDSYGTHYVLHLPYKDHWSDMNDIDLTVIFVPDEEKRGLLDTHNEHICNSHSTND